METGRLLISAPATGATNMAIDQSLLELAETEGTATLRFYQWQPATLSLGYFQSSADRNTHSGSLPLDWVRRTTGGGAIVHDRELTYSLVVPQQQRWSTKNELLYDVVHESLIQILSREYGIRAERYGQTAPNDDLPLNCGLTGLGTETVDLISGSKLESHNSGREPFLCFQRRAAGDLVTQGFKVLGSAQRRFRKSLLQHGSLLLQQSRFASELPGLADLGGKHLDPHDLAQLWQREISKALTIEFLEPLSESSAFRERVEFWVEFHQSDAWRNKR